MKRGQSEEMDRQKEENVLRCERRRKAFKSTDEMKGAGNDGGGEQANEWMTRRGEVDRLDWAICGTLHTNTHHFQLTRWVSIRSSATVSLGHWFPSHRTDLINIWASRSLNLARRRRPHPRSITRSVCSRITHPPFPRINLGSSARRTWDDLCHHLSLE